jgi:hypothetical protein
MKKKSNSQSAFFNLRILTASVFCLLGIAVALFAQGKVTKQTQQINRSITRQDAPGTQRPDVVQMVGPVHTGKKLSELPYVPPQPKETHEPLRRYPYPKTGAPRPEISLPRVQSLLGKIFRALPNMPPPLLTFEGIDEAEGQCNCVPPDTIGDVGPNHYVETTNIAIKVFDKNGNTVFGPQTFDAFFQGLGGTPCGTPGQNNGDPFVFYDHMADRWVISDFAFPGGIPGNGPFYQCIGVSDTADPAGTYTLYALQHEPSQITWIGDYPKFAAWDSGGNPAQNAYFFTVNLFDGPTLAFEGVRVFALDRASMLAGGPANAIAFTVPLAGVGDSYSFVAANFRTGDPPPAGRDEMVLAVDGAFPGVTLTQVHARFFHVDFADPGNSTFGVGADHTPNAEITVAPFVQAWTAGEGFTLVPQLGTGQKIDTLGDKIMTPVVYQNRNGTESLWAAQTTMLNFPNGPSAVTWYQFDVTGGNFPATPVQQQEWTNGNDGLWRFMPSIAVDADGNTAIGYSVSSGNDHPGIRYAGRLANDPLNDLGQGEATMFTGAGSQLDSFGRWGDYSMTTVDPTDGMTFFHANEYYEDNDDFDYRTRIGKFNFVGGPTPTPTATATPSVTPTVTPTPGRPSPTPRPRPTPHPRP